MIGDAAFIGLAGEVVDLLGPHTEADRVGLLATFLSAFGAAVGPGPHALAESSAHPARLNVVLVGRSARARKGTSWAVIRRLFDQAAPDFSRQQVIGGLSSGEGLVAALERRSPAQSASVLVHEPEFARLLRVAQRNATLSALLREAWDGGDLAVLTRKAPLFVRGANVAVLGHVTAEELRRRLDHTEIANGLGNRFLYFSVERSKRLPNGGAIPDDGLEALGVKVHHAITRARAIGRMERSAAADARWADIYCSLDDDVDGVVGALSARAEGQMLRLSVVYALLDGSPTIEADHVDAAKAVWDLCVASIERVFAGREPDTITERLLEALEVAGPVGLDGSAQRDLFSRHVSGDRLAAARWELEAQGLATTVALETNGRPRLLTRVTSSCGAPELAASDLWSLPSPPRTPRGGIRSGTRGGVVRLGSDNRSESELTS